MNALAHLFRLCEAFGTAAGLSEATVSTRLFRDGKGLARLRAGGDVGTRRLDRAMAWLSANWPEGAEWPPEVPRPETLATLAPDDTPHHETDAECVA